MALALEERTGSPSVVVATDCAGPVELSYADIGLSAAPMAFWMLVSMYFRLGLSENIIVSTVRTFLQLTVVGYILVPVFSAGEKLVWVVVGYVLFMIILAAWESAARPKYTFVWMYVYVFLVLLFSIALLVAFTFGVLIKADPWWDPQYVIPIAGMLLGNSINGMSLALNSFLANLYERKGEVELYLSFGADKWEATRNMMKEAIRTGLMPTLNSMSVIGLISIPGMMTGQVLGGTPPQLAARYQMMIMYMIAFCGFTTTIMAILIALVCVFDGDDRLITQRMSKRKQKQPDIIIWLVSTLANAVLACFTTTSATSKGYEPIKDSRRTENSSAKQMYVQPAEMTRDGVISAIKFTHESGKGDQARDQSFLRVQGVKRVIMEYETKEPRILFQNLSLSVGKGEIVTITGPSGAGKSQFLRIVSSLDPIDEGTLQVDGRKPRDLGGHTHWRRSVRYVTQTKVSLPGTPLDFIKEIVETRANQARKFPLTLEGMTGSVLEIGREWNLLDSKIHQSWGDLSGGEAQRMILAIALASKADVLLMDEPTSALDPISKVKVEETIMKSNITALWVTHDEDQRDRLVHQN